jgi:hypothetical protein
MKILTLIPLILLTGCVATPVPQKFPEAVPELVEPCPEQLHQHPNSEKLSDQLKVVTENYAEYHTCKNKVKGWIKWYNEQKKIFDESNK